MTKSPSLDWDTTVPSVPVRNPLDSADQMTGGPDGTLSGGTSLPLLAHWPWRRSILTRVRVFPVRLRSLTWKDLSGIGPLLSMLDFLGASFTPLALFESPTASRDMHLQNPCEGKLAPT